MRRPWLDYHPIVNPDWKRASACRYREVVALKRLRSSSSRVESDLVAVSLEYQDDLTSHTEELAESRRLEQVEVFFAAEADGLQLLMSIVGAVGPESAVQEERFVFYRLESGSFFFVGEAECVLEVRHCFFAKNCLLS